MKPGVVSRPLLFLCLCVPFLSRCMGFRKWRFSLLSSSSSQFLLFFKKFFSVYRDPSMHVFFFCLQGSNSFPIFHIQLLFIGFSLFVARCYSLKVSLALSLSLIIVRLITITIIFHIFLFRVPLNRTAGRDLHAR